MATTNTIGMRAGDIIAAQDGDDYTVEVAAVNGCTARRDTPPHDVHVFDNDYLIQTGRRDNHAVWMQTVEKK